MKVLIACCFPYYFIDTIEKNSDEPIIFDNNGVITTEYLTSNNIQIILLCGYDHILSESVMNVARCIGVHFSMLPLGRGPEPLLASWINNEPIGVTLYELSSGLDEGPIIAQCKCPMDAEKETLSSSMELLFERASALISKHWKDISDGTYNTTPQLGNVSIHTNKQAMQIFNLALKMRDRPISAFLEEVQKEYPGFSMK